MIIFSNHPLAQILINEFKDKNDLVLVCDKSAAELIKFARNENVKICEWEEFRSQPFWDNQWSIVFSFGHIIPENIINLFCHRIANIHPSLLPLYRGSSPLQSTILDDQPIGYTIIKLDTELDSGDILMQKKMEFDETENYDEILRKIIVDASKHIEEFFDNTATRQDHSCATYCKKITHSDLEISESDNAKSAYAKTRCYFPTEKAYLVLDGKKFFIHKAQLNSGKLEVTMIQPEGKRVMDFKDFANGYSKLLTITPSFVKIS